MNTSWFIQPCIYIIFLSIYLNKWEFKLQFVCFKVRKRLWYRNITLFFNQKQGFVISTSVASYKYFQVFSSTDLRPQTRSLGLWYRARILHMLWETGWRLFQAQNTMSALQQPLETKKTPQHILIILKQRETKEKQTVSENSWHQFGQPLLDSCPERGPARHLMQKKGCCLVKPCVAQECCNQLLFGLFQLAQRWSEGELRLCPLIRVMRGGDEGQVPLSYLLTLSKRCVHPGGRKVPSSMPPAHEILMNKCLYGRPNVNEGPQCASALLMIGATDLLLLLLQVDHLDSVESRRPETQRVKELVHFNLELYLKATLFLRLTWFYCWIWYVTVSASTLAQCHWSGLTGLWCGTILAFRPQFLLKTKRVQRPAKMSLMLIGPLASWQACSIFRVLLLSLQTRPMVGLILESREWATADCSQSGMAFRCGEFFCTGQTPTVVWSFSDHKDAGVKSGSCPKDDSHTTPTW